MFHLAPRVPGDAHFITYKFSPVKKKIFDKNWEAMKLCRDPPAYITHRFRYNSTNYNCCFSKAQLYLFHYFERAHGSSSTGICGPAGTSAGSCSRMLTAISMACTQCSETRFFIFCKQKRPKTFSLRCSILTDYKLKKKRTCK